MKLKISGQIFKNTQLSAVMKILIFGVELFLAVSQTDKQTDLTNL